MNVAEYKDAVGRLAFKVTHGINDEIEVKCPECASTDTRKIFGIESSYVRGYGFLDKKGVKNDMDLHLMTTGNDPYKSSRTNSDRKEVVTNLQKKKERNKRPKKIHL